MTKDGFPEIAGNGLLDRRVFLRKSLVFAAIANATTYMEAGIAQEQKADLEPWMKVPGKGFSPYGQPSPHEAKVIRSIGFNFRDFENNGAAWTPLEHLQGNLVPNGLHFVRSHQGTPDIDPTKHFLYIHGELQKPWKFSIPDLLRMPMETRQLFLECGGNSNSAWAEEPVQRPVGAIHGLVSASEWTGVPVSYLFKQLGVNPSAKWVVATGGDAGAFDMSIPLPKLLDDCLIGLYQNGERLRPENGYPARLIVPGWKAVLSIKWLTSLELSKEPAMSRNETARYTELLPSGKSRQFSSVMEVKSVITSPSHDMILSGPGIYEITGLAWSGHGKIKRVEVSADGGKTWAPASLSSPNLPMSTNRFRIAWKWDGKSCVLKSRAIDEKGNIQPTREALIAKRGAKGFYHFNAIISWEVDSVGYVSHTYE
jgi:sulfane dehydrogenase subunit SoxC